MLNIMKPVALVTALAAGTIFATAPGYAADPDCDTIRMVVPWKAGGGTDRIGRGLAAALEKQSGKSVIVDNISGASSATGSIKAIQSDPDGCTLLMNGTSEILAFMTFTKGLPFSLDDARFVGGFFTTPTWMLANKERGYEDFQAFLDDEKANPGKVTIGVGGAAGAHMVMAAAIKGAYDLDARIVPYSGGADLAKALLANQVNAGVIHSPVLLKEVKAGLIDVLTTGSSLENIVYPPLRDLPTLESMGKPINVSAVRGLFVPKDTPDAVVQQLATWTEAATKDPDFIAFGEKFGFPPKWVPGPQFEADMRAGEAFYQSTYDKFIK